MLKKYSNGAWTEIPCRKYGTETDIITSLPAQIIADGTPMTEWEISGNMEQTGTPTPENPITPSECGDRTVNLFDKDESADSGTVILPNTTIYTDRKLGNSNNSYTAYLPCKPNTTYRITKVNSARLRCGTTSEIPVSGMTVSDYVSGVDGSQTSSVSLTSGADAKYICIFYYNSSVDTLTESEIRASIQVAESTVSVSYEPYGYKIPINSRGINLFDKDNADIVDLYPDATTREIKQSANLSTWSIVLPVEPSTTYTFTMGEATTAIRRRVGMCSDYPTKGAYCTSVDDTPEYDHPNLGNIFTTDADTRYVLIMYVSGADRDVAIERANRVQVVKGNAALPYEPYVQPTLSNIYLGNVQTTRYIKKRVFDGTENWTVSREGTENEYYAVSGTAAIQGNGYSSHYIYRNITTSNTVEGMFVISTGGVRVRDKSFSSVSDFKSFLAQQYANGTPVTVWYVLATPTTGIVNEPLRKIGDYADTVSYEQAQVSIPTLNGQTVVDVDTTLKPSEVELTYKGWHPHEEKKRENGEWS